MRITVTHARVDPAEVRALVRFAFDLADADRPDVEVHVKRSLETSARRGFRGTAYDGPPSVARVARGTRYLVALRLPDPDVNGFPYRWSYHRAKTAVAPTIETWREALVYLAGHEARHVRQYVASLPRSEVDAEASGLAVLRRYRDGQG